MEYRDIVAATTHQFEVEERDIEARKTEVDSAQALLDRLRKALKRKRSNFEKMLAGWQTLDAEIVSGKPAAAEEPDAPDERREPGEGEAAA
jgi:hypothetical protein